MAARSTSRRTSESPKSEDPHFWTALATGALFVFTLPALILFFVLSMPQPQPAQWEVEAAALGLTPYELASGASTYARSCAVCHGPEAEGVPNLGKPLRNSAFVQSQSDEALFELIVKGRAPSDPTNTTGALMPPRGAQGLSDEQIHEVIWYMRAIQDRSEPTVAVEAWDLRDGEGGGLMRRVPRTGGRGP
jgi:disulfide bond formation protein DsbB